jgi:alcohol dehydrogenase YqhD (iron-dependent ADH family)
MQWYADKKPERFSRFAKEIFGVETAGEGIKALKNWFSKIGAPVTLQEVGIHEKDIPAISANAVALAEIMGIDDEYSEKEIQEVLQLAL